MKDNESKFSLPLLPEPRTLRVRFCKVGNLQYISHLDLQRTFNRVLVRAGLPLWYTKGFNPHVKMVFGLPLSVGAESECEFLDIRLEREMSEEEVLNRLRAELTEELCPLEVYRPTRKFEEIAFADYLFTLTAPGITEKTADEVKTLFGGKTLTMLKRTKSGEKETDILPLIKEIKAWSEAGKLTITAVLSASGAEYLNPEYLVKAIREKTGIFSGDPMTEHYRILRRRVYLADGKSEFR